MYRLSRYLLSRTKGRFSSSDERASTGASHGEGCRISPTTPNTARVIALQKITDPPSLHCRGMPHNGVQAPAWGAVPGGGIREHDNVGSDAI